MESVINKGFSFGEFELDLSKRLLLKQGEIVGLNPKAFDLLSVLVENHGKVLSKNELLEKVWENQFVEENNLTVHVAALRKILGEKKGENRFIATLPGRGYSFVAAVEPFIKDIDPIVGTFHPQPNTDHIVAHSNGRDIFHAESANDQIIGRGREIAEIKNLLRREGTGLLTLTGAGGAGKTRLARALTNELAADFPDGVFFIELAAINDAKLLAPAIAQALGIKESGDKSLIEALKIFLRERRTLLILDNFEQLIDAAPLVRELSAFCSFLKILVTSRSALQLDIEHESVVIPLAVPPRVTQFPAADLAGYASVTLFVTRARAAKSNFVLTDENAAAVAEICHKLDGLPLAIELAAARVKFLSPPAILSRLESSLNLLTGGAEDLPARQRTMRRTIEWSYNLLGEEEKHLFRRLAIFAGGFTIESAEKVCGGQYSERNRIVDVNNEIVNHDNHSHAADFNVLDGITSLLNNHLLTLKEQTSGEARLRMLEVVREFALECLEDCGEFEALRQDHARFFLELAEEAEPHLLGSKSVEWLEKLEIEHDNLRTALGWAIQNNPETAARIAAALRYFWSNRSHLGEGRRWLEAVLENCGESFSDTYFKLLNGLGQFARYKGDFETARKVYEKALTAGRGANEPAQIAITLHGLAAVTSEKGDFEAAKKFNEEELAIYRELNDESGIAYALASLGDLALAGGDITAARPLIEESLEISRKLGNKQVVSINLVNLGLVTFGERDYEAAYSHFSEALTLAQELGNKTVISCSLDGFAALSEASGDAKQAAMLAGAAEELRESIGFKKEPAERRFCEAYIAKTRAALGEETFVSAFEQGCALNLNEAVAITKIPLPEFDFAAGGHTTEIIIENHRFSRIVVDEEIEEIIDEIPPVNGTEPKAIAAAASSSSYKTSVFDNLKNYSVILFGAILAVALIGVAFLWQQRSAGSAFPTAAPFSLNNVRQLTTNGKVQTAALSPDGKLFAYVVNDFGQKSLWLGFVDGGNHLLLRPAAEANYYRLTFSPDSANLYFSASDEHNSKGALYKMPVLGGVQEKILDDIGVFSLSPDGKRLLIARNNPAEKKNSLIEVSLDKSGEREIVSFPNTSLLISDSVSWSPDGKSVAVGAYSDETNIRQDIYIVRLADSAVRQITQYGWGEIIKTAWLKNGDGLMITALDKPPWSNVPQYRIWQVTLADGETRQVTGDLSSYRSSLDLSEDNQRLLSIEHRQLNNVWVAPSSDLRAAKQITFSSFGRYDGLWGLDWTPDGKIVFTSGDFKSQIISIMNADGSERRQLTPPGFIDSALTVSNDGRFIVFHSIRGGGFDIWRMNIDGSNPVPLTSGKNNYQPFISADSRWVYYKSWEKGAGELRRVSIEGGEPEILNDRETSWGSFSPDGKYFGASYKTDNKTRLAMFSGETGEIIKQFDFPKTGTMYMGSRWTPDNKSIVYRDNAFGYWQQPVDGGEARRIEGFPKEKFYNFAWSKDGKWFAFVRGQEIRDVVLFRNLK